jgi:hypothetical protein
MAKKLTIRHATPKNEVLGFACGGEIENPELKTDKDLVALYVHPAAHRRGTGFEYDISEVLKK